MGGQADAKACPAPATFMANGWLLETCGAPPPPDLSVDLADSHFSNSAKPKR